ncbi:nuclear transport factor 2 family protein [Massilia sp. CF038]|uniref:nuclear transport factor 2 family protein n=1 Tax=Massilia sp. CF038 TaxID=1881045 RepID=UPI000913287F|nr:nuclear transport factor 2 family protein [Massilia sp. CF038]SHH25755.1 SnoaL-like domain-containing protein [Massilia sp. CF038]
MTPDLALKRLVHFFENISPESVRVELPTVYAPQARFKDPFNDVNGHEAISAIFAHMFEQVEQPRFVVTGTVLQGQQAFLTWDFLFTMKRFSRTPQCIKGATHLVFGADGAVTLHRDYWDAAEELYEKLPVLGALMRWLKRAARR